jgi:hypothetical protein
MAETIRPGGVCGMCLQAADWELGECPDCRRKVHWACGCLHRDACPVGRAAEETRRRELEADRARRLARFGGV